jgi:hypothetical protein
VRALIVELDSVAFFRSSFIQLDGEAARTSHVFEFAALPAGRYDVSAVLIRTSNRRTRDAASLQVQGAAGRS